MTTREALMIREQLAAAHFMSADLLCRYVQARAGEYFDDLGDGAQVKLRRQHRRTNSQLYELTVEDGPVRHGVVVKVPFGRKDLRSDNPDGDRPRLAPRVDFVDNGWQEFAALSAIHDHFTALGDPRFGTIRPLELFPSPHALALEHVEDPCLTGRVRRGHRFRLGAIPATTDAALHNAGRWLRHYQQIPPLEHTETRHATRGEIVEALLTFTDYVARHDPRAARWPALGDAFRKLARRHLPRRLPLGLCHGDFAPRNVLAAADGRATVFDTQAVGRSPVYEDVGHFLVALKVSGPHVTMQGLLYDATTLARFERAFLDGFFGSQSPPWGAIRLFECLRLMEWWGSLLFHARRARGWKRPPKRLRAAIWTRYIARYVERLIGELWDLPPPSGAGDDLDLLDLEQTC